MKYLLLALGVVILLLIIALAITAAVAKSRKKALEKEKARADGLEGILDNLVQKDSARAVIVDECKEAKNVYNSKKGRDSFLDSLHAIGMQVSSQSGGKTTDD